MKTATSVLIVGAGPVGLLLATELARAGVDVLLIDRLTQRSFFCKALGITPKTLEIFDELGIAQDAIDSGVWLSGITSFTDGIRGPSMKLPEDLPFGSLSLAQFGTERLLEACLHRHGGSVAYGWTLTGFTEQPDRIRAELLGTDGTQRVVDCQWLVGCDGAHSRVRAGLGLDFAGGVYPQTFVLADLEVAWDLPRGQAYRFNHSVSGGHGGASLVAIPVHGSECRYRLSTVVPDSATDHSDMAAGEGASPGLAQIQSIMVKLLPEGTELSSLHWSSVYRVSHRIVPAYWRGHVFLAGDAAHLHPPVGGQGMNTGLQDAHNLAWKLALADRGLATPALLDSYSTERHAVGLDVVENTSRALNDVLAQRAQLPGMRETQLLISYRDSPIVRDERAETASAPCAAGDRAPDVGGLRRRFVGHAFRLHDRFGRGRHVLIGWPGDNKAALVALAEMLTLLRAAFGDGAVGFAIVSAGQDVQERDDLPIIFDAGEEFAGAYAAQVGMAWLVRPDGYIGWCSAEPSVAGLRSFLEQFVLVPPADA